MTFHLKPEAPPDPAEGSFVTGSDGNYLQLPDGTKIETSLGVFRDEVPKDTTITCYFTIKNNGGTAPVGHNNLIVKVYDIIDAPTLEFLCEKEFRVEPDATKTYTCNFTMQDSEMDIKYYVYHRLADNSDWDMTDPNGDDEYGCGEIIQNTRRYGL